MSSSADSIPWNASLPSHAGRDGLTYIPIQVTVARLPCLGRIEVDSGTTSSLADIPIFIQTCGATLSGIMTPLTSPTFELGGMLRVIDMIGDHHSLHSRGKSHVLMAKYDPSYELKERDCGWSSTMGMRCLPANDFFVVLGSIGGLIAHDRECQPFVEKLVAFVARSPCHISIGRYHVLNHGSAFSH